MTSPHPTEREQIVATPVEAQYFDWPFMPVTDEENARLLTEDVLLHGQCMTRNGVRVDPHEYMPWLKD